MEIVGTWILMKRMRRSLIICEIGAWILIEMMMMMITPGGLNAELNVLSVMRVMAQ